MDQVSVVSLIATVGTVSAVVFGYVGYSKGVKKDSVQEGKEKGTIESNIKLMEADIGNMKGMEANIKGLEINLSSMQTNITYIMKQNDNLLYEQREANKNHNALADRVTRVEESTKSAHKRIDQMEEGRNKDA